MSEPAVPASEPTESREPTEVGRRGSFFVGCALGLCALLAVGVVVVWRAKAAEDRKRKLTVLGLESIAIQIEHFVGNAGKAPAADALGADWTGLKALAAGLGGGVPGFRRWEVLEKDGDFRLCGLEQLTGTSSDFLMINAVDGWGNPLRYRCPGVVHKQGWDLYSCGPNGKDDQGTFDDLLVGEDVVPVTSR